ncbi:MAG: acyltransferase [Gallionella sp.]|nr:acyltransferase [Gallionella sp.]
MGLLTSQQILEMGFKSVGKNVSLSDKSSYYNCKNICIGNNVRVDDFCVLSAGVGGIEIGSYVHIAVYTSLIGAGKITLSDFCNISSKVAIYSSSDDYSGEAMTNPMVPTHLTKVEHADVFVSRHVIVGSGSVILPGVTLAEGVAIGAMSLVKNDCAPFGIFAGIPVKRRGTRRKDILDLEKIISI